MKSKLWVAAMLLTVGLFIGVAGAGCNTLKGAGKDIQKGGQLIEETAEKTGKKMRGE